MKFDIFTLLVVLCVFDTESTRRRAYGLVAQAYTSIMADDFAAFVGYSVEDAVKGELLYF